MRKVRIVALALCASVLAACGNPGESLKFSPPSRFGNSKTIMGMIQIWTTSNNKEVLMLMKLPVTEDPKTAAMQNPVLKNARLEKQEAIKICGNQSARHFEMLQFKGNRANQRIDAVMSPVGGATYMAMYGYPEGSKPDPQAESAILDLCAK
jgi:hypothetical protein